MPFLRPIFVARVVDLAAARSSSSCLDLPADGSGQQRPQRERQRDGSQEKADAHATAESRFALHSGPNRHLGLWSLASRPCAGCDVAARSRRPVAGTRRAAPERASAPGKPVRAFARMDRMAATKTTFTRDAGLQSRMLITMFLLGALYVVFVGVLFAAGVQRLHDPAHRRRARGAAVLHLRQARAARDGRPRGHAAGGARAARDDRAPLHPGRPAQAEDRGRLHRHAQRLRDRQVAEERDGLRDDRDHEAALARRARGRHGARARARQEPRRDDHDDRLVLRLGRRDDPAVRLLLRRRPHATTTTARASS